MSPRVMLAFLMVLAACGAAPIGDAVADFERHLDDRMPALMERFAVPGAAVAVLADGESVIVRTYGIARSPDLPITRQSVNHVGSISKPVTAWGVMRLAEAGLLDLDGPVSGYLKTWQFPQDPRYDEITVRQLLNHTAGLAIGTIGTHYDPGGDVPSLRENLTAEVDLVREPGTGFGYSNVGFNLLELLIEDVTGEPFATYMQREVLSPLGMKSATFEWDASFDSLIPHGHDLDGSEVAPYVYPEKGSGGLFATIDDVAAFVAAVLDPGQDVLSPATLATMFEPSSDVGGIYRVVTPSYGLGYFVETTGGGTRAVWHGGQGHGWMTHFHAVPEAGDGIVILTNSQRSWPLFAEILDDWSGWAGHGGVGMSRIGTITAWLAVALVVITCGALVQLLRVVSGLTRGKRRVGGPRWATAAIGVALATAVTVLWAADPLYLRAVFPVVWPWVGVVGFAAAAAVLLSALTTEGRQP